MQRFTLIWDAETVGHLARHGVSPQEAEDVCQARPYVLHARYGRYAVLGQTDVGRYLTVIVSPLGQGRAQVITARAMTKQERRQYLRR